MHFIAFYLPLATVGAAEGMLLCAGGAFETRFWGRRAPMALGLMFCHDLKDDKCWDMIVVGTCCD